MNALNLWIRQGYCGIKITKDQLHRETNKRKLYQILDEERIGIAMMITGIDHNLIVSETMDRELEIDLTKRLEAEMNIEEIGFTYNLCIFSVHFPVLQNPIEILTQLTQALSIAEINIEFIKQDRPISPLLLGVKQEVSQTVLQIISHQLGFHLSPRSLLQEQVN